MCESILKGGGKLNIEVIFKMFSHFHWKLCLSTVSCYLWTCYTSLLKSLADLCSRPSFFLNLLQCMERCVCAWVETQSGPGSHLCVLAHPQRFAALYHPFSFSCLLRFTSVPNFLHLVCCFNLFDLFEFPCHDCSIESILSVQSVAF